MYLIFDTETTSFDRKKQNFELTPENIKNIPRIVQLAFILYNENAEPIQEYNGIVKPDGFIIDDESIKFHGVTNEYANKHGKPIVQILNDFFDAMDKCKYLIAHNMSYDAQIIYGEYYRYKLNRKSTNKPIKICTKELTTDYCAIPSNWGYKWPKLEELYRHLFNEDFENAHNALYDVLATQKCFFHLINENVIQLNNPKHHYRKKRK